MTSGPNSHEHEAPCRSVLPGLSAAIDNSDIRLLDYCTRTITPSNEVKQVRTLCGGVSQPCGAPQASLSVPGPWDRRWGS